MAAELVNRMGRRAGWPILRSEIHAPKMWTRRKKLHADTRPFFGRVAKINHSAFLLFFSHGINQYQVCAESKFLLNVEQPSVGVDHDRLAILSELTAVDALARRSHRYASENARTAALFAAAFLVDLCLAHVCQVSCMAQQQESTTHAFQSA
jgi:hypothetical protein